MFHYLLLITFQKILVVVLVLARVKNSFKVDQYNNKNLLDDTWTIISHAIYELFHWISYLVTKSINKG